jgi:hypothetical protein
MSYAQYRFTIFEEDLIEKHFPGISYIEETTCCKYIFDRPIKIDFPRLFCQMMHDPLVRGSNSKMDFWVVPEKQMFLSCPGNTARNIWEYYLYTCKELAK